MSANRPGCCPVHGGPVNLSKGERCIECLVEAVRAEYQVAKENRERTGG